MPAAAPAAPPAPAANAPAPASVGSAVPPSTGVINLGAPPAGPAPEPPKPGTARAAFTERLRATAKTEGAAPAAAPAKPAAAAPAAATPPASEPKEGDEPEAGDEAEPASIADEIDPEGAQTPEEKAAAAAAPKVDGRKTKVNPWKLADEHKARAAKAEAEVVELRKLIGDPEARKSEVDRLAKIEARNKELEQHIQFVDYAKSQEFIEKYQQPYEQQWTRSMSELREIVINDPTTGQDRNMKPADLLELVNMPLNKARERAEELYGSSANDVMDHRREVRKLYDAQAAALEKARKDGAEFAKTRQQQTQAQMAESQKLVAESWEKTNNDIMADPKVGHYFRPVEGDTDANSRLEKGYKFVDEAFSQSPMDPKLTAEQRASVVKKHAAVRHRAAAFGRMRYMLEKSLSEKADLQKKLAEYESSTPEMAGRQHGSPAPVASNPRQSFMQRLQGIAKPA